MVMVRAWVKELRTVAARTLVVGATDDGTGVERRQRSMEARRPERSLVPRVEAGSVVEVVRGRRAAVSTEVGNAFSAV